MRIGKSTGVIWFCGILLRKSCGFTFVIPGLTAELSKRCSNLSDIYRGSLDRLGQLLVALGEECRLRIRNTTSIRTNVRSYVPNHLSFALILVYACAVKFANVR